MKIRALLALPLYILWTIVYFIGLILCGIAAMVHGDTDIMSRVYDEERR